MNVVFNMADIEFCIRNLILNLFEISEFALDPKLKEYIRECKDSFAAKCASLDVDHLEYHTFTKKLIKERKLSPDAIMQFVIQVKSLP